jgi:hypothetical protein
MVADAWFSLKMWFRFRTYRPFKVTPYSAYRWLRQFSKQERRALRKATEHLHFVSVKDFMRSLIQRNRELLRKIQDAGVPLSNIIYVSVGDAGSSSHATLTILRDQAGLENLGCKLADGRSFNALEDLTNRLGSGAIIYVDDFAGTGKQFTEDQGELSEYIFGNFSQYFLVHTACEEAVDKIDGNGVSPWPCAIHRQVSRPLHEKSSLLGATDKQRIRDLCSTINRPNALGWGDIAVSVVIFRNTPDNVPCVYRGTLGQRRFKGLVPRVGDLPADSALVRPV